MGGPESIETQENNIFEEILSILTKLIEEIGSLNPQTIKNMRNQIADLLGTLNLSSPSQMENFAVRLAQKKNHPVKPEDYPEKEAFSQAFERAILKLKEIFPEIDEIQGRGNLNLVDICMDWE